MSPGRAKIGALIVTALVFAVAEGYYLLSPKYGLGPKQPYVATHVPTFNRVEYCQIKTTERAFDICMRLPLHTARILRFGPYYSRSLGRR